MNSEKLTYTFHVQSEIDLHYPQIVEHTMCEKVTIHGEYITPSVKHYSDSTN